MRVVVIYLSETRGIDTGWSDLFLMPYRVARTLAFCCSGCSRHFLGP